MGLREWWSRLFDPQPPDAYANRPAEFQHICPLPPPRYFGMTWVCETCDCPWMVYRAFPVSGEKIVIVDSQRPWLGSREVPVNYWQDKLHWRFDLTTHSRRRDYPHLDREKIRKLEEQIGVRADVDQCVVVCPSDPSLSRLRPIILVQPTPGCQLDELERFCRETLAREVSLPAAQHPDAVQLRKLPLAPDGAVDRARIDRDESARLAEQ